MAIHRYASYNQIKWDTFITVIDPYKVQPLTNRSIMLEYIPLNNDYDVLKKFINKEFYKLPFIEHTVKHDDRIDNITFKYYGDPDYWWAVMLFNKLIDPFELGVSILKIPNPSKLFLYLTRQKLGAYNDRK